MNSPANPAKRGSVITFFVTGGGLMNPPMDDGSVAVPPFSLLAAPVIVNFPAAPWDVLYAGAAPGMVAGVLQINVRIPETAVPGPYEYLHLVIADAQNGLGVPMASIAIQ